MSNIEQLKLNIIGIWRHNKPALFKKRKEIPIKSLVFSRKNPVRKLIPCAISDVILRLIIIN